MSEETIATESMLPLPPNAGHYTYPDIPWLDQPGQSYPFGDYVEPEGPAHQVAQRFVEATSSNRINMVDFLALPGKCAICGYAGSTNDIDGTFKRRFVDFGLDVDYYGVVGFCETCVAGIAYALGFIPAPRYKGLVDENSALKQQNQELGLANSSLRDVVNLLSRPDSSPHFLVSNAQQDNDERNSEIADTEHTPDESTDESGSDDLSSIASDEPRTDLRI